MVTRPKTPPNAESPSKPEVEDQLRRLIIAGEFAPLTWIREESLAAKLGVSRTPVREACARLSSTGLIERVPRRGFRLPALDETELNEVYPVVVALEVLAIESIREPSEDLVAELAKRNFGGASNETASKKTVTEIAPADYATTDYQWHRALVAASGNRVLLNHFEMLYAQIARFIHFYWADPDVETSRHDHQMIADAVGRNDAELAKALLKSHRRVGLERIRRLIAESRQGS